MGHAHELYDAAPLLDAAWMLHGNRHLCPDHVAAAEQTVAAAIDGLQFDDQEATR